MTAKKLQTQIFQVFQNGRFPLGTTHKGEVFLSKRIRNGFVFRKQISRSNHICCLFPDFSFCHVMYLPPWGVYNCHIISVFFWGFVTQIWGFKK
ncbi:hypothetical protein XENTR_v10019761 [Xenopus tropicalis]|nr:hypothetical protein XENTR_v10019761 [Xenopus tropicalis]